MTDIDETAGGHFVRLEAPECLELLREAQVGRLAFVGPDGLTLVPLSCAFDGDHLVLRTGRETQLAALGEGTQVAFEVDDVDLSFADGWSVLVRGTLSRPASDEQPTAEPMPFVPGEREVALLVSLDMVTGRAVSARD